MLQQIFNKWAVPVEALVPTFYKSESTLRSEIMRYKDKDYGIKKLQAGGRGRVMLIAYDSLPSNIKQALGDPHATAHLMENFYSTSKDAVAFFTSFTYNDKQYLPMQLQDEYITNASVLIAAAALKAARVNQRKALGGSTKGIMATVLSDVMSFQNTLKTKHSVEHTLPSSLKRFKELFDAFVNTDGTYNFSKLISKKVGNKNSQKVKDNMLSLLNDLFSTLGHKPTRTEVARMYDAFLAGYTEVLDNETGELYNPKDYAPLSYNTITNYLGQWQQRIAAHHLRSGNRQVYMGQYKPAHKLEKPKYAGSLISIDDRQPPFYYDKDHRVWFYMGIDLASEAWIAWVWGKSKEGLILDFYRDLVRKCHDWGVNIPLGIECESSLNSSFTNSILKPGVMFQDVRIEANNARGKRIERYFGALRYGSEKERSGWMGRPHARNEANQLGPTGKQIIPFNDIVKGSLKDIEDWNNAPHSSDASKSRFEYWLEMQNANTVPTNYHALLPHIGYSEPTSCNAGIVRLQNTTFLLAQDGKIATGDTLINLMKRVEGKQILVYWLDDLDGKVFKAHAYVGDAMQCELIEQPTYSRAKAELTNEGLNAREIMSSYVATIESFRKMAVANITPVTIIETGTRPELKKTFQIRGLDRYTPTSTGEVEVVPDIVDDDTNDLVEIPSFSTTLKNRF